MLSIEPTPPIIALGIYRFSYKAVDQKSATYEPPVYGLKRDESGAEFTFTAIGGDLSALVNKWAEANPSPVWSSNNPTSDLLFRVQGTSGNAGSDKIAVNLSSTPVPEPSTYGLIGAGTLGLIIALRRFRKR